MDFKNRHQDIVMANKLFYNLLDLQTLRLIERKSTKNVFKKLVNAMKSMTVHPKEDLFATMNTEVSVISY